MSNVTIFLYQISSFEVEKKESNMRKSVFRSIFGEYARYVEVRTHLHIA